MPTREEIIEIAQQCYDPEIPVNIWDLGLIYEIETAENESVAITMSLTSQACPAAQQIPEMLRQKILASGKAKDVAVKVVFDPPWTPERITEDGKKRLGLS